MLLQLILFISTLMLHVNALQASIRLRCSKSVTNRYTALSVPSLSSSSLSLSPSPLYDRITESNLVNNKGYKYVIGCDEAGRGPLAGPVVVCSAICLSNHISIKEVDDSKKLTEAVRESIYNSIINDDNIIYDVSIVSSETIDDINILAATMKGMTDATENVVKKTIDRIDNTVSSFPSSTTTSDDFYALIDGNKSPKLSISSHSIVKGDSLVYSIAIASIVAKVTRDHMLIDLSKQYPQYGFDKHKGYGTKAHIMAIHQHGPIKGVHRYSFAPIKNR